MSSLFKYDKNETENYGNNKNVVKWDLRFQQLEVVFNFLPMLLKAKVQSVTIEGSLEFLILMFQTERYAMFAGGTHWRIISPDL